MPSMSRLTSSDIREFVQALPKTETHLHLEGALPFELLQRVRPGCERPAAFQAQPAVGPREVVVEVAAHLARRPHGRVQPHAADQVRHRLREERPLDLRRRLQVALQGQQPVAVGVTGSFTAAKISCQSLSDCCTAEASVQWTMSRWACASPSRAVGQRSPAARRSPRNSCTRSTFGRSVSISRSSLRVIRTKAGSTPIIGRPCAARARSAAACRRASVSKRRRMPLTWLALEPGGMATITGR